MKLKLTKEQEENKERLRKEKIELLKEKMSKTRIPLLTGYATLLDLCDKVGVKQRIAYYNMLERPVKKELRTMFHLTEPKKVVHDYGFEFNNGFQIRHVERAIFTLYSNVKITEIRERT